MAMIIRDGEVWECDVAEFVKYTDAVQDLVDFTNNLMKAMIKAFEERGVPFPERLAVETKLTDITCEEVCRRALLIGSLMLQHKKKNEEDKKG